MTERWALRQQLFAADGRRFANNHSRRLALREKLFTMLIFRGRIAACADQFKERQA